MKFGSKKKKAAVTDGKMDVLGWENERRRGEREVGQVRAASRDAVTPESNYNYSNISPYMQEPVEAQHSHRRKL